jgi:hypothetical protein
MPASDSHFVIPYAELARINFLPEKQRKQAVAEMIDHARRKGVKLTRPALGVTPWRICDRWNCHRARHPPRLFRHDPWA